MKTNATEEKKLLLSLAAVLLVAALLAAPAAEATRYLPSTLATAQALSPSNLDVVDQIDAEAFWLFAESDVEVFGVLALFDASEIEQLNAQNRIRLFEDSGAIPRPLELAVIRKLASGFSNYDTGSNIWKTGDLAQNCGSPSFQGLWTDPITGIAYARNRWYDARNASWLSEDPKGAVDSVNLYAFVGWGPHMGRDPMGMYEIPQEEIDAWTAAHPGWTFTELNDWMSVQNDVGLAAENAPVWYQRAWEGTKRGASSSWAWIIGKEEAIVGGSGEIAKGVVRWLIPRAELDPDREEVSEETGQSGRVVSGGSPGVFRNRLQEETADIAERGAETGTRIAINVAEDYVFAVGAVHLHHTIPRQVRKSRRTGKSLLPEHLVEHPDIRGKKGNPNRWPVPIDEHVGKGGIHNQKPDFNSRFIEEIDALEELVPDRSQWTVEDITEIRDRLAKEFDIGKYRPE